jgi:hypothetical protein
VGGGGDKADSHTPTHAPSTAASRSSAAAVARGKRRQTSGVEAWRQ